MATTYQTPLTTLADKWVTVTTVSNTAANNVTNATAGTLYMLEADNSNNDFDDVYLKIIDANTATPGTTQPKISLYIPAKSKQTFVFKNGHAYTAGLSLWATRHAVYTDSTKADSGLTVKLLVTE